MGEPSWNLLSPPSPRLDSSSCSLMLGTDTEGELQWGLSPVPGLPRGAAPRALAPPSWLGTRSTRPWHMEPVVLPGRARPPQNTQGAPGSTSTPPKCLCHAEGRRTENHGTGWTPSSLLSTADHSPLVLNPSLILPELREGSVPLWTRASARQTGCCLLNGKFRVPAREQEGSIRKGSSCALQAHCSFHCSSVPAPVQGWATRERHRNQGETSTGIPEGRTSVSHDSGEGSATHCSARAVEGQ